MSLSGLFEKILARDKVAYDFGKTYVKEAGTLETSYSLAGRLYVSKSGWLLLSVPNSVVRGLFDALDEPGLELPVGDDGKLNAHISIMSADEVNSLGGSETITERGHTRSYTLGKLKTVVPDGWEDYGRVWLVDVHSPELEKLRKSYGLSALPHEGKYRFHITVACRRKKVLQNNDISKLQGTTDEKEEVQNTPSA